MDHAVTTETIDQIIQQKMMEMFTEQFESLKDKVVTVIANKISSFIEENNNLRIEIQQLTDARETEKKEVSVVHHLVTTFNTKLSEVKKQHGNAIQEMQRKVQSISTMLENEGRFSSMDENENNENKHVAVVAVMKKSVDSLHKTK